MLDRNISFNSIALSYLKRVDSLSEDKISGNVASTNNALAYAVNRTFNGDNVRRLLITEAKIAGIANIEIGLMSFRNENEYPSLFFEKVDFAMLSAVSIGLIEICEEGNYFCVEDDDINVICSELSIIPRFSYPLKGANGKDFPASFFRGTFRYRYRISTGASVRRFLYRMYDNVSRDLPKDFRKIEPHRSFSSFLSIKLLRTFFDGKWCDRLLNVFCR